MILYVDCDLGWEHENVLYAPASFIVVVPDSIIKFPDKVASVKNSTDGIGQCISMRAFNNYL